MIRKLTMAFLAGGLIAGCSAPQQEKFMHVENGHFADGGEARPQHLFWQRGDCYCGDPAQEEQGLYSVFDCDSTTVGIIVRSIDRLNR